MKADYSKVSPTDRDALLVRLLSNRNVDANGCWIWTGFVNEFGYGVLKILGRRGWLERAHRLSFYLHTLRSPEGICILHRCDVPQCFNPEHLFVGTKLENTQDMIRKGRAKFPKGKRGSECNLAKLNERDVRKILARAHMGESRASLGRAYGVSIAAISRIVLGINWKHITAGNEVPRSSRGRRRGAA